ncbi:MAG: N-acetyltransferase [Eubacteriales bacterium]
MDIEIIKANPDSMPECVEALEDSELGRRYFSSAGTAHKALQEGFDKKQIYIAQDSQKNCLGFLWYVPDAMFHSFPFLHIIAVKRQHRGKGIGKKMLGFFEDTCFESHSKVFLVVADFNPKAQKLYESMGYEKVGVIPGLYREGITENLMMKKRPDQ